MLAGAFAIAWYVLELFPMGILEKRMRKVVSDVSTTINSEQCRKRRREDKTNIYSDEPNKKRKKT